MPTFTQNKFLDIRPVGPSGSVLKSYPAAAYDVTWEILSDNDIADSFAVNSITTNTGLVLVGDSLTNPRFFLDYNRTPSGASIEAISSGIQTISSAYTTGIFTGTFSITGVVNSGYTFRVRATGLYGADSIDYTVVWCQKIFYGISNTGTYNSAFIGALPQNALATGHSLTASTGLSGSTNYWFYAFRAAAGHPVFTDLDTNLRGGISIVASGVSFNNGLGFTESYNLYRTDYPNLGSINIRVSPS